MVHGERELIERHFSRLTRQRDDVVLGIGDDAALLRCGPGQELVVSTDTLVEGIHFAVTAHPADIGHKSLAVNLSDIAAMGADPAWATLSLTLPDADEKWLGEFAAGFGLLAERFRVTLAGGDLCRGPLSITVQVIGQCPAGAALRRSGARPGDHVYVTGMLGCAALALHGDDGSRLHYDAGLHDCNACLQRPEPRVREGRSLRGIAHACIDLSDGLITDLGHLARSSDAGAEVRLDRIPVCPALRSLDDPDRRLRFMLGGGDDYELCFTAAADRAEDIAAGFRQLGGQVTRIGTVTGGTGICFLHADGSQMEPGFSGYRHF